MQGGSVIRGAAGMPLPHHPQTFRKQRQLAPGTAVASSHPAAYVAPPPCQSPGSQHMPDVRLMQMGGSFGAPAGQPSSQQPPALAGIRSGSRGGGHAPPSPRQGQHSRGGGHQQRAASPPQHGQRGPDGNLHRGLSPRLAIHRTASLSGPGIQDMQRGMALAPQHGVQTPSMPTNQLPIQCDAAKGCTAGARPSSHAKSVEGLISLDRCVPHCISNDRCTARSCSPTTPWRGVGSVGPPTDSMWQDINEHERHVPPPMSARRAHSPKCVQMRVAPNSGSSAVAATLWPSPEANPRRQLGWGNSIDESLPLPPSPSGAMAETRQHGSFAGTKVLPVEASPQRFVDPRIGFRPGESAVTPMLHQNDHQSRNNGLTSDDGFGWHPCWTSFSKHCLAQTPKAEKPDVAPVASPGLQEPVTMASECCVSVDEQLKPILQELDSMKLEAAAVLSGRRPEINEQLLLERALQIWGHEAETNVAEEGRRRGQAELAGRQRELVSREQQLAVREQELASREADVQVGFRGREQHIVSRERRFLEREEQLVGHEQRLADREEQLLGREKRLADREADLAERWEQFTSRRQEVESRSAELEQKSARLEEEEEKLKEWWRQLEERELRWSEACKEAQVTKHYHPRQRLSPRRGKENQELQRQLEEQQSRMHEIKRKSGSWSPDCGSGGNHARSPAPTPPVPPATPGEIRVQRHHMQGFTGTG